MRRKTKFLNAWTILKQNWNNKKKNANMKRMSIFFMTWRGTTMGGFGQVNMTECALMDLFCVFGCLVCKGVFLEKICKGRYRRVLDHLRSWHHCKIFELALQDSNYPYPICTSLCLWGMIIRRMQQHNYYNNTLKKTKLNAKMNRIIVFSMTGHGMKFVVAVPPQRHTTIGFCLHENECWIVD